MLPVTATCENAGSVLTDITGPLNVLAVVSPVSGAAESFCAHLALVDSRHLYAVLCLKIVRLSRKALQIVISSPYIHNYAEGNAVITFGAKIKETADNRKRIQGWVKEWSLGCVIPTS